jgi:ribosomal protein L11 methylase PrmA
MRPDPGSFRDPSGRVYLSGNKVYRTVSTHGAKDFQQAWEAGILHDMAAAGRCVETRVLSLSERAALAIPNEIDGDLAEVLAHPLIPFVSYPYEWPFDALKAAAVAHLDLHLAVLARGFTLSDASAYNMQFIGPKPVHIDALSIVPYVEGTRWMGYDQFKKHFLNPLMFEAATGVSFAPWFRGSLDGISGGDLVRLLPWRRLLRPSALVHVLAPALFDKSAGARAGSARPPKLAPLPKGHLIALIESLKRIMLSLRASKSAQGPWLGYETDNSYSDSERAAKHKAVAAFISETRPGVLLDIGCNTGEYAEAALGFGAERVIGVESDRAALGAAFRRAQSKVLNFYPLDINIANPSPGQGWRGSERKSFVDRLSADGLLALAVLHHLVIAGNVPLADAVGALVDLAPSGIIEFVPKSDSQVQRLLRLRADIFHDYDISHFEDLLSRRATVISRARITDSGRTLFRYERLVS